MKKILYVVTNADLAGAPLHVFELVKSFDRSQISCEIVFGEHGKVKDRFDSLGYKTHVIATMRSNINPLSDIAAINDLIKIVDKFDPDMIHCHSSKAGLVARVAALIRRKKVVYTVHGWGFGSGRRFHISAFVKITEFFLKYITDKFIAVSDMDRLSGIKSLKINPLKIQTIHNGVSFSEAYEDVMRCHGRVIMVARNEHQKDYKTLCAALASADFAEAYFVGKGTDDPDFVAEAKSLLGDVCSKVKFLGLREDVSLLLRQSSVFVLSSRFEGLPLSIIEAMAAELPIIASDVGGCSELVVDGVNGYLFESSNSSALSTCISKLTASESLSRDFGLMSKMMYSKKFSAEIMRDRTLALYNEFSP